MPQEAYLYIKQYGAENVFRTAKIKKNFYTLFTFGKKKTGC